MTTTAPDPESASDAYARLSARFKVLWTFHQFLQGVHRTAEDDRQIASSTMRRFFERVKAGDEDLLLSILKFYYYANALSPDEMDKVDILSPCSTCSGATSRPVIGSRIFRSARRSRTSAR